MSPSIDYATMPHQYAMCCNEACPLAAQCLRKLAYDHTTGEERSIHIINPKWLAAHSKERCIEYRPTEKVKYAKGITQLINKIPHGKVYYVTEGIVGLFSRRTYYRIRKGERLLSPAEQRQIISMLRRNGISEESPFDSYVEVQDW